MTNAVQPLIVASAKARRPEADPKADLRRYYMLAHGCHLIDTARYLAGDLVAIRARLSERAGIRCWFVEVEFSNGALGLRPDPQPQAVSLSNDGVPGDALPELLGNRAGALTGDPEALQQLRSGLVPFSAHAELLNALAPDLWSYEAQPWV
jgi:hypothetical protein